MKVLIKECATYLTLDSKTEYAFSENAAIFNVVSAILYLLTLYCIEYAFKVGLKIICNQKQFTDLSSYLHTILAC